jgi:hypothetical protein
MAAIQLKLTDTERKKLREIKIKISELVDYTHAQLQVLIDVSDERARELHALADFQRIPTLGVKAAEDLIFMGYYSIEDLKGLDGAQITDQYERKKGYRTDVCVEDQFRLAVHFAKNRDHSKRWWDFTAERKAYRKHYGYPASRPVLSWFDLKKNS